VVVSEETNTTSVNCFPGLFRWLTLRADARNRCAPYGGISRWCSRASPYMDSSQGVK